MNLNKPFIKKPEWIKPELNTVMYYIHVAILATVALGILQWWKGGDMLTVWNVIYSIPILTVADFAAHTILGLD